MNDHSMVERVARAIGECQSGPWDFFSEEGKECLRNEARAAIKAMREPTPAMVQAGLATGSRFGPVAMSNIFATMINAALMGEGD